MSQETPAAVSHVLTIRVGADEARRSSMIDTLRGITGPTQAHPRCRRVGIYLAVDDPGELTLIEEWETLEAMTAHFHTQEFRAVLSVIDMSNKEPEVRLDSVTFRGGFDHLARMFKD